MPYNPALDGLRALAVLAVVVFHSAPFASGGFIGVDVFFVLSGYLITTLLRGEVRAAGTIAIGRFYWRRALRLWPPLLLMLWAYAMAAPFLAPGTPVLRDVVVTGVYLSDYSRAFWGWPDLLSHTWSLSVEEHFYLLWPLVILVTARVTDRALAIMLAVLFIAATAWRCIDLLVWGDWARTYYRFDTRLSGLLAGGLLAVLPWRMGPVTARATAGLSLLALGGAVLMLLWRTVDAMTWGGAVVDVAAFGLVASMASGHDGLLRRVLSAPVAVYLGLISYSVYLWHYPIARAVRDHLDPMATLLVVAASSMGMAAVSYELVERPIRAWRRRS